PGEVDRLDVDFVALGIDVADKDLDLPGGRILLYPDEIALVVADEMQIQLSEGGARKQRGHADVQGGGHYPGAQFFYLGLEPAASGPRLRGECLRQGLLRGLNKPLHDALSCWCAVSRWRGRESAQASF